MLLRLENAWDAAFWVNLKSARPAHLFWPSISCEFILEILHAKRNRLEAVDETPQRAKSIAGQGFVLCGGQGHDGEAALADER